MGGLEKWTTFMDVTCVSSLALKLDLSILKDAIFVTNGIKEPVTNFRIRFWKNLNVHPKIYLNGFLITQRRKIQTRYDINIKISVSSFDIENTHSQKLLDVTIDHKLNFHDYVLDIHKKASVQIVRLC